jgi:hypothetical protein
MTRTRLTRWFVTTLAVACLVGIGPVSAAVAAPAPPAPVACSGCYHPAVATTWNWVISSVPTSPYRAVQLYDVDGFENTSANVTALHNAGIKVVCYISAGTYENWRPDAAQFPASLLGKGNGWPGEKWLDIRDVQKANSTLRSIMDSRLDMCKQKGFDMVELDNVDGYSNKTGFPLTAADQLFFNDTLANDAHARGLSVLQKNDVEQTASLLPYFDGALNEQCNQYSECSALSAYVSAGKPVFNAEYKLATGKFCAKDNTANFNGVRFSLNLDDSTFQPCR